MIGALPTGKGPDGSSLYTLPAIYDPSTGTTVSDSTDITIYLDAAYPNTPKLFLPGTHVILHDVLDIYFQPPSIPVLQFALPAIYTILNPSSQSFFRRTKEGILGMAIKYMSPKGKRREEEWAKVKEEFNVINSRLPDERGPFIIGSRVSFLDFVIASHVLTMKNLLGETSKEWNDMKTWNRGRWVKILKSVEKYEVVI